MIGFFGSKKVFEKCFLWNIVCSANKILESYLFINDLFWDLFTGQLLFCSDLELKFVSKVHCLH